MSRTSARRAVAALGAVAVALTVAPAAAHASPGRAPLAGSVTPIRQINYSVNGQEYYANADGSGANLYSANPLAWSSDGSRFVTQGSLGLHTQRWNGTDDVALSLAGTSPAWSPDGVVIVAVTADHHLSVVGGDGSPEFGTNPLFTPDSNWSEDHPAIAPNGTVVFERTSSTVTSPQLWQYVRRTHALTKLIDQGSRPDFSADGTQLAYAHQSSDGLQLWTAGADGSNQAQLTHEANQADAPRWAPDGSGIYYWSGGGIKKVDDLGTVTQVAGQADLGSLVVQPDRRNAVDRVWGQDQIDTAVAASQFNYSAKNVPDRGHVPAHAVVLSRDDLYYDALVGSAFAIKQQAPLLITNRQTLDSRVEAEINRILGNTGTVYLLGGELALSSTIANRLTSLGYTVDRIWGQTHFDTALAIDARITTNPSTVIVTTGINYYDALAAGAAAGANPGTVIVLTNGTIMPPQSATYLNTLNPDPVTGSAMVAAGGPGWQALLSAYQNNQMPNWTQDLNYFKLVGQNEKDTALLIARFFFYAPSFAAVATNYTWFDALTGGAMIGADYGPLLITDPSALYPGVSQYLSAGSGNLWETVMLGGPAALPTSLQSPIGETISLPGEWDYNSLNPDQLTTKLKAAAATSQHGDQGAAEATKRAPGLSTTPETASR